MEIEVVVPAASPATDCNFDSTTSSPYITAPSSPTRFGNTFFFSAPTSPSSSSEFSRKRPSATDFSEDFEFNFSGQLEKGSFSAADELFDGGKIRPLQPPHGYEHGSAISSPRSKVLKKDGFDSFPKKTEGKQRNEEESEQRHRGRERSQDVSSGYVRKGSRSLSPLRVSDIMLQEEDESSSSQSAIFVASATSNHKSSVSSSFFSAFSFPGRTYKKWKLKDLLLFRSASEGRPVPTKESLKHYEVLPKKETEEMKNLSFRSTDSGGGGGSSRRRPQPVSPHEMHYTANRAVSEELKRKTFLPYKQGWLGCLGFNPGVHDLSRVGSLTRGAS